MNVYKNPPKEQWVGILKRPTATYQDIEPVVSDVFEQVKAHGDHAIAQYTEKFDAVLLSDFKVSAAEIAAAKAQLAPELQLAIIQAKEQITAFHQAQITPKVSVENIKGVHCWQEKRPIEKVGIYIPGGSAPLFSTILMLAMPAQIAGCKEIVLCTPPNKSGAIHPAFKQYSAILFFSV